jgi:hypothetical protein
MVSNNGHLSSFVLASYNTFPVLKPIYKEFPYKTKLQHVGFEVFTTTKKQADQPAAGFLFIACLAYLQP